MNKLFIFLLAIISTYQEEITMNPNSCTNLKPFYDGSSCIDKTTDDEIICHSEYYIMGTAGACKSNCDFSSKIYPYLLYKNGEYICVPLCKTFGQYLDASDSSNPRCVERCPEYQHFILPNDADDKENECLAKCPEEEGNNHPYAFLKDNLFYCQSKDVCTGSNYIDELTSDTFKYCVPSCLTIHRTAFISVEKKCVTECGVNEYIDYSDVEKPKCVTNCGDKYIDSLTNSTHPACVASCYTLDPPAYIGLNKHCVRECKADDGSQIPIDFSNPQNPKCVATCPTSDPKTYKDSDSYSNPICVLSCWDQKLPKYIDGSNCIEKCKDGDNKIIDNLSDQSNPKCVSSCPIITIDGTEYTTYKDALTNSGYPTCVFSCKKLQPSAVINIEGNECISTCPSNQYINDIEALHPQCIADCSTNTYNKYIEYSDVDVDSKMCVKTCRPTYFLDKEKKQCIEQCPDKDTDYIDQTSVYSEIKAGDKVVTTTYELWCNDKCPDGQYISKNSEGYRYCVPSCKNLVPSAYIVDKEGKNYCDLKCSDDYPYLDALSDPENPTCVSDCKQYYRDDITSNQKKCQNTCVHLRPLSYFYYEDANNKEANHNKICTTECSKETKFLIFDSLKKEYECVESDTCEGYIDNLTFWNVKVCTKSCRHLIPEAYINEEDKICTRECPKDKPFLIPDENNIELICKSGCPDKSTYYIDALTQHTVSYHKQCVKSCNNLNPPAFIDNYDPDNQRCVRDCKDETFNPYVDALTDSYNPICVSSCPTNTHIDKSSTGQMYCVRSCKNLRPSAYLYADPDIDGKTTCVRECPSNMYVNPIDPDNPKCSTKCPTHYYLDNELTTPGLKICVESCHTLPQPSYIYIDPDNNNQQTCIKQCPNSFKFINAQEKDMLRCVAECPLHTYMDDELTLAGEKICVPSCKNLIPTAYIYWDEEILSGDNVNKEKCVRKCPADAQFINPEDIDKPRCSAKCPTDYYQDNELTAPGIKMCVPSCLKLEPTAYIYKDPDDQQEKCVRQCPTDQQYVEMTDPDKPRCVSVCPEDYFLDDEITIKGIKMCVPSCNNQNPPAFIYTDPITSVEKCIQKCPNFAPYLEKTDPKNPRCQTACPADHYLDNEITTVGLKICVSSCKNLNPTAYIYNNTDLSKLTCVHECPQHSADKYVDRITDPDFPKCVSACPIDSYINTIIYYDEDIQTYINKECVPSCKNLVPSAYIYSDKKIDGKETCLEKCPYNLTHKYFIDATDPDFPRCKSQCPDNYYIDGLTVEGIQKCVPSCRNLQPLAYIYTDQELKKQKCTRQCPSYAKYIDKTTDPENPKCSEKCPDGHFIDEVTIEGISVCTQSCKNQIPTAYLFTDGSDENKIKCVHACPESAKYVDATTDPDYPKCVSVCPENHYIDSLTISGVNMCVKSCYNLDHNLLIYEDPAQNNYKTCVRNCSEGYYINAVDPSNPFCTQTCPDKYFIDEITSTLYKYCVSSCKELTPPAYLDSTKKKCVRECNSEYYIIDEITDPDYPVCVNNCGTNHIYTSEGKNFCVESCIEYDQYIYTDKDDSNKTKCKQLCPKKQYIDYLSTDYYFKNPSCVSTCVDGYYIDKLTNTDKMFCVPSCKKLIPLAYIDTNLVGQLQCERSCNIRNKYIDNTTDPNNPKCVSQCPDSSKYIFDTEKTGIKYCVDQCRLTPAKPLIDEITNPQKPDCVESCRKTAPYLDEVSDSVYPKCLQKCPKTAKYLDLINNPEIPVCLDKCQEKAPYHDEVTNPAIPQCVTSCTEVGTYQANFYCLACSSLCKECAVTGDNCTKCAAKHYLDLTTHTCPEVCPEGYYGDPSEWACKECYTTCQTCSGRSEMDCTSCKDNYILTSKKECIEEKQFIADMSNMEIYNITSFDELDLPLQQISDIGNLQNFSNLSTSIQYYMIEAVDKSMKYLDQYIRSQNNLDNIDKQTKLSNNLKKVDFLLLFQSKQITNTSIQLPVDSISTVVEEVITKIDYKTSNETVIDNLCQTTSNMLKYMKEGSKNFNNTQASYQTSQNTILDDIQKIGDIGIKVLTKDNWNAKRMLSTISFQHLIENEQFSMILESHSLEDEKWLSEIEISTSDDNFFYYEQHEKIKQEDLIKLAINYPKSFVEEIKNKIDSQFVETILVKIISYNYLQEANNKYSEAVLDTQTVYGSVVTFEFQYQLPKSSKLNNIDLNDLQTYIAVKIPINYKLNGYEDLQCMTYDEDTEEWTDDNVVTAEKTDTYVICRTRQLNAITIIDTQEIEFKKNYALYFAFFQIPFAILILFIFYLLRDQDSQGKKYLSFSPLFSSFTALNGAHLAAKIMLFSFQLALIGFFVAVFYNFNHWLNQGETKHVVLCIVYSLLINYGGKYFFGIILTSIQRRSHSCVLFTLFLVACYLGLSFGTCYFVYNPEHDKFYNIGLYTTLIAFGFDFIAFDLLFVILLLILKLDDDKLKIFSYGGYLSINPKQLKQIEKHCISEENQMNLNK